ncbi:hypothetical protein [Ilumatobacter sp.]|uniref:hypothetical protein n=1 Tax=Ilumatobacter sp. TaxID=1967498 RepID=UPI0037500AAA
MISPSLPGRRRRRRIEAPTRSRDRTRRCSLERIASGWGSPAYMQRAVPLMINRYLSADVGHYLGRADVWVIPPPCPLDIRPNDFSRAGELIDRSYASTV